MVTTLDIGTIIYKKLSGHTALTNALSGGVFKDNRPANSSNEDVVVNIITIDGKNAQRGTGNVNIHVPSLRTEHGPQPNHTRLKALSDIVTPLLKEVYNPNNNYWVETIGLIKEPNADEWYLNYRIRFKYDNTPTN